MDEREEASRVRKLINKATDYRQQQRDTEYITNVAQYEGHGWELASYASDSPFILKSDINHLKDAVDIRLGSLYADTYYGVLKPQSPDDVEAVEALNVLYKNEWYRLKMDDLIELALKDGALCDNGYIEFNFDTEAITGGTNTRRQGLITAKYVSASEVWLDPNAASIDDCDYIVKKMTVSKEWLKREHPDWLETLERHNGSSGIVGSNEAGDIYVGRNKSTVNEGLYLVEEVQEKYPETVKMPVTDETGIPLVDENGKELTEKITRTRVKFIYMIGDTIVEINKDYPFDDFNIVPFQWQPIPQSPYGIPLVRGLVVPQRVANLIESAANNIAMHYTVPTWLVAADSGINLDDFAKMGNALGMAWLVEGDASKAVAQLPPPAISADLMAIRNDFVSNIHEYAGSNSSYTGDVGTAGSTAEGTLAAINRATIIDNNPLKQISIFVEKLSRLLIKFMTRYYSGSTVYIRQPLPNDPEHYQFNSYTMEEAYSLTDYDFNVDLASRSKTDKNRQYNLIKEIYQLQNQYKDPTKVINVTDVVKAAQLDNYTEMFKRYQEMSEEAYQEKADLIVQLMTMAQTTTPNGQPLISAEEIEQGIIDVLNDDNDLSVVQSIFAKYQEYQTAVTEFNNNLAAQQRQTEINNATQMPEVPNDLIANIIAQAGGQVGSSNTMDNTTANPNNTSVNG